MFRYSLPLIPPNLCSWVINISDRYLIALLAGSAATGIYAVVNKLPTALGAVGNVVGNIFLIQCWGRWRRRCPPCSAIC